MTELELYLSIRIKWKPLTITLNFKLMHLKVIWQNTPVSPKVDTRSQGEQLMQQDEMDFFCFWNSLGFYILPGSEYIFNECTWVGFCNKVFKRKFTWTNWKEKYEETCIKIKGLICNKDWKFFKRSKKGNVPERTISIEEEEVTFALIL